MTAPAHRGIALDDERNAGPLAALRPSDAAPAEVAALLHAAARRTASPKLRDDLAARAERVGRGEVAPPPPRFRGPGEYALADVARAAHPDLVTLIRDADRSLPQTGLCLLWGRPALVHPVTGVVFAVAVGSVGVAARLPGEAGGAVRGTFDVGRLGEGWLLLQAYDDDWALRAYAAAGEPRETP